MFLDGDIRYCKDISSSQSIFKYIFNQNPNVFFAEIEKPILKFIWNLKGPNNLEKEEQS